MKNIGKLRRLAGAIAGTLVAATLLLTFASAAQAEIDLPNGTTVSNSENVEVVGVSLPEEAEGTTHVTAALCDLDGAVDPEDLGLRCKQQGAKSFTALSTFMTTGVEVLNVQDVFSNWDFTTNSAGVGTTECAGTGDEDCGIVVSYYAAPNYPAPPYAFLHAEAEEVTF
jgi:hypothetical protein